MRIVGNILLLSCVSTLAFSEVSICYKKNHSDISTIENIKLDGGACAGNKSQIDMQKDGWKFENLQIKDDGYLFIFKKEKEVASLSKNDSKDLESKILAKIESKKQEEIKITKEKVIAKRFDTGKTLYTKKCSSCHGQKGEISVGNSKALNSIDLEHFQKAMKGYKIGSYSLGNGSQMRDYSIGYTSSDIKNIDAYIKKINTSK